MNKEQEVIDILKRTIKNSNYCDSIGTGQIEIILNYIDKLQQELKDSINARFELQRRIDKTQKENAELKEEIKDLIKENHKHIDYIADMKKKHEDKIRTKIEHAKEVLKNLDNEQDILVQKIVINYLEELLGDDE